MRRKLTDKGIERLAAPKAGRRELWDVEPAGFGLRVTDKGTKTFQLFYRFDGKLRRKTLGRFGVVELADARERARQIIRGAKAGVDPELQEEADAAERALRQANTFAAVSAQFIELYAKPKNRSWAEVERYFKRDLAKWNGRPVASITRRDVIAALDAKARDGGPYAANQLFAHVRKMMNWAVSRGVIAASPAAGIERPGAETERERVLSESEIKALWSAWDELKWPFGPMLRLLLVTGQRRDEVAGMRWPDVRPRPLDAADGADHTPVEWVWIIPGGRTKGGRSHDVPLSPLAIEILGSLPRFGSHHVFPARGNGDRYASGFSKGKRRSDELSGVSDWRIHDLRRTAGTGMAAAGIAVSTISRVLNHAEGGVTKIYNRYSYGEEKRRALETWARRLEGIVGQPAPANVVPMRAER